MELEQIGQRIEELEGKAAEVVEQLEKSEDPEGRKALEDRITELDTEVKSLTSEREKALHQKAVEDMRSEVTTMQKAMEELRAPTDFTFGGSDTSEPSGDNPYAAQDTSFYADAKSFLKMGDAEARERIETALGGKAMTSGTGSAGGFLVPDQISSELITLREQTATLRSLFSRVQVNGDTLRIASVTGGLVAGWVAELAEKPAADLAFGEQSVNVFTAAGLAVASNQLLADANRSVDRLVNTDLAKRLSNLEELAFIGGTGTGQPQGILNTSGVNAVTVTPTDVLSLLDAIVDAITSIYTNYFGAPNAILMHPRTWARIIKAREASSSGTYLVGSPAERGPENNLPGYSSAPTPRGSLFGVPVYTTANVPTNLGTGTDESRVIVGNFNEGLILDRQGITLDSSPHVYFTSNQTVFRAEERVGFTAARYPKAFTVVGGAGLAGG